MDEVPLLPKAGPSSDIVPLTVCLASRLQSLAMENRRKIGKTAAKDFNNNIKDGKRTEFTPARLYRIPQASKASAPKRDKDIEAAYHGVTMSYRDNVKNTTRIEHYPKFSNGGDGMRESAARQQQEQERRRNDPDHRDEVSSPGSVPGGSRAGRYSRSTPANCRLSSCCSPEAAGRRTFSTWRWLPAHTAIRSQRTLGLSRSRSAVGRECQG